MTGTTRRGRPPGPPRPGETIADAKARRARDLARYYEMDPRVAWARAALSTARARAREFGLAFAITSADLLQAAGTHCPALGVELDYSRGRVVMTGNSATVDRIIPPLGYVVGNVAVISAKANTIKGRAEPHEIFAVGRWHGKQLADRQEAA